ncbi:MAG: hypothetical protein KGJ41_16545 [Rhodospirillales bacterium]|nr:hypothetical protein [Rhodospirillales bacterium]MDE2200623.1 hypothetical protein [Rhodospirillales bacterium]MDE2574749.1 hypothetical protein [Rhodospirillales bacterium]
MGRKTLGRKTWGGALLGAALLMGAGSQAEILRVGLTSEANAAAQWRRLDAHLWEDAAGGSLAGRWHHVNANLWHYDEGAAPRHL